MDRIVILPIELRELEENSQTKVSTMPKTKAHCETCNGSFGLIRHRYAYKQFCSKQCLYLAKTRQQASKFKQWIDFSRNDRLSTN
jgi:hypothetical protein